MSVLGSFDSYGQYGEGRSMRAPLLTHNMLQEGVRPVTLWPQVSHDIGSVEAKVWSDGFGAWG